MIRAGDQVVLNGWEHLPATVKRIYYIDSEGEECSELDAIAATCLLLDWGEHGTSRVYLHDCNVKWHKFTGLN
jgi:hypothetical protein